MLLAGDRSKRVASDVNHIDALSLRKEPQILFVFDHVEREVKLLQLQEVLLRVKLITVKFKIAVTRQIKPF